MPPKSQAILYASTLRTVYNHQEAVLPREELSVAVLQRIADRIVRVRVLCARPDLDSGDNMPILFYL